MSILVFKKSKKKHLGFIFIREINLSFKGGGTLHQVVITFTEPMRGYIVKKNHIGSVISKILGYKQTDIKRSFTIEDYFDN